MVLRFFLYNFFSLQYTDIFTALGLVYVEPFLRNTDSNFCDINVQSVLDSYSPTSSVKNEGRVKAELKREGDQEKQMVVSLNGAKREGKEDENDDNNDNDNNDNDNNDINEATRKAKDFHQAFQLSLDLDLGSIDLT